MEQCRAEEKSPGPERRHNDFLRQRISPIGPQSVKRIDCKGKERNCVTRANYICLRSSALNYAELLGKELGHEPSGNIGACIADLYNKLSELEPSLNLNIEPVDDRLHFVFWKPHKWGDYSLYWLNAKILNSLKANMREAALLFFQKLRSAVRIPTLFECDDIEFILECMAEAADGYDNDEDRFADRSIIASYLEGGEAYRLLQEIRQTPSPDKDLGQMLACLKPDNEKERQLLDLLREGLKFTEVCGKSILGYEYDQFADEHSDDSTIEMERMVRFIYDDDLVCENMIEWLNNEFYNGSHECSPCTTLVLKPNTGSTYEADTFPEEFFAYMDKLLECVNNY